MMFLYRLLLRRDVAFVFEPPWKIARRFDDPSLSACVHGECNFVYRRQIEKFLHLAFFLSRI